MWTAEVVATERRAGALVVTVRYARDGGQAFSLTYGPPSPAPPSDWLEVLVNRDLDRFTALDAVEAAVPSGPVTPKEPDPPAKEVAERNAYFALAEKLAVLQRQVVAGAVAADDPAITALAAEAQAAYKPEYFGL